jgi:SAM-dependent methyltransferase
MIDALKTVFRNTLFHPRFLAQREIQRIVAEEAPRIKGRLLDVGCGKKPYAGLFSNANTYIGVDVPSTMHGYSMVDIFASSAILPFMNCCMDGVICTEVLEHSPDPLAVLVEINRVTKAGGLLLLTAPLSEQLHEEPYDYFRFTKYGLQVLLEKSGWKIGRIDERGGTWLELGYRLSSFLYSSLGARRGSLGNLTPRLVIGPIMILVCAIVQGIASLLDQVWHSPLSTIGYGVLAEKWVEPSS